MSVNPNCCAQIRQLFFGSNLRKTRMLLHSDPKKKKVVFFFSVLVPVLYNETEDTKYPRGLTL